MPDDTTKSPMKILIHAIHYPVSSARYAADAFKRLGHDVRHVGQETGRQIWGMDVDEKYAWHQEPPEAYWKPDLAILMDTAYQWHYPDLSVPTIVWTVDNHVRNTRQPEIVQYFLAHHDGQAQPVRLPDEQWLPCAYSKSLFTPSQIPYQDRDFDVCLIGVLYPNRQQLVNELRAAGLKVLAGTGLIYDQYVAAYQNARISLCMSIAGDVAQRVFETAAMGCLVMSDACRDYDLLKPQGININAYAVNMVADLKYLLSEPTLAQEMIAKSLEWVRPHTWDARAQVIVDWLQKRQAGEAFYATAE